MIRFTLFILLLAGIGLNAHSQTELKLRDCQRMARKNYPALKQKQLLQHAHALQQSLLDKQLLPQITLNAQATYQSEVTSLPITLPGIEIPSLTRDQYRTWLDFQQPIYTGGKVKLQQSIQDAALQADQQSVEVELHKIKGRINDIYFSLLLLQEQDARLDVLEKELKARLAQVKTGIKNGVLLPNDRRLLEAEILAVEMGRTETAASRNALMEVLEIWLGQDLPAGIALEAPELEIGMEKSMVERPEILMFSNRKLQIEQSVLALDAKRKPFIGAFAQTGFGRPGLNFLSNSFSPWALVGVKFSWKVWDWGAVRQEREVIGLQAQFIDNQQETFEQMTKMALVQEAAAIEKQEALIGKDAELLAIRAEIRKTAASQLANGSITTTDYLSQLNQEQLVILQQQVRKVQILRSKANYLTLQGKL